VVDDGNPCTTDSCDAQQGIVHTPLTAGWPCPDGDLCNGDEQCDGAGTCQAGTVPIIDDGNSCTADSCDPLTGNVTHPPEPSGTTCADANQCDGDEVCDGAGTCAAGAPPNLDDGDPCTIDACTPQGGITHSAAPAGTDCAQGAICNDSGQCTPLPTDPSLTASESIQP